MPKGMAPKGTHKMPDGHMMSDKEMEKMMPARAKAGGPKRKK